jgi:hypothetical protein
MSKSFSFLERSLKQNNEVGPLLDAGRISYPIPKVSSK